MEEKQFFCVDSLLKRHSMDPNKITWILKYCEGPSCIFLANCRDVVMITLLDQLGFYSYHDLCMLFSTHLYNHFLHSCNVDELLKWFVEIKSFTSEDLHISKRVLFDPKCKNLDVLNWILQNHLICIKETDCFEDAFIEAAFEINFSYMNWCISNNLLREFSPRQFELLRYGGLSTKVVSWFTRTLNCFKTNFRFFLYHLFKKKIYCSFPFFLS